MSGLSLGPGFENEVFPSRRFALACERREGSEGADSEGLLVTRDVSVARGSACERTNGTTLLQNIAWLL